jgi:hypothetical protein
MVASSTRAFAAPGPSTAVLAFLTDADLSGPQIANDEQRLSECAGMGESEDVVLLRRGKPPRCLGGFSRR